MSLRFLSTACLLAALAGVTPVRAQVAPLEAPKLNIGDRWKVERSDSLTRLVNYATVSEVTGLEGDRVQMSFDGTPDLVTTELTYLDTPRLSYDVGYQFLKFPLQVGKGWTFKTAYRNKESGNAGVSEFTVEPLALEKITVGSGTYDAVKLQAKGTMTSGSQWRVTITYWYAPQARRIVRLEWRDHKRQFDYDEELVEVQLARSSTRPQGSNGP